MKTKKKQLTLGEFIAAAYDSCGKRKAAGMVRLALQAHFVQFLKSPRLAIS